MTPRAAALALSCAALAACAAPFRGPADDRRRRVDGERRPDRIESARTVDRPEVEVAVGELCAEYRRLVRGRGPREATVRVARLRHDASFVVDEDRLLSDVEGALRRRGVLAPVRRDERADLLLHVVVSEDGPGPVLGLELFEPRGDAGFVRICTSRVRVGS